MQTVIHVELNRQFAIRNPQDTSEAYVKLKTLEFDHPGSLHFLKICTYTVVASQYL